MLKKIGGYQIRTHDNKDSYGNRRVLYRLSYPGCCYPNDFRQDTIEFEIIYEWSVSVKSSGTDFLRCLLHVHDSHTLESTFKWVDKWPQRKVKLGCQIHSW